MLEVPGAQGHTHGLYSCCVTMGSQAPTASSPFLMRRETVVKQVRDASCPSRRIALQSVPSSQESPSWVLTSISRICHAASDRAEQAQCLSWGYYHPDIIAGSLRCPTWSIPAKALIPRRRKHGNRCHCTRFFPLQLQTLDFQTHTHM